MGDSDDEFDRRRDKFQRERSDQFERRAREREWNRERYEEFFGIRKVLIEMTDARIVCFLFLLGQLASAKFQAFACNLKTVGFDYTKF